MSEEKRGNYYSATMLVGTNTPCDKCDLIKDRVVRFGSSLANWKTHHIGHCCLKCYGEMYPEEER